MMGLVPLWRGHLRYLGEPIDRWAPDRRVGASISYVSEGGIFAELSVEDNLRACGTGLAASDVRAALRRTWDTFPLLAERREVTAGSLSGGPTFVGGA
jgi:branched-chain amino acid transport system ATP-binding protein